MKAITIYLLTSILVTLFVGQLLAQEEPSYTYDGELDPQQFFEWDQVPGSQPIIANGAVFIDIQNPDKEAVIKYVRVGCIPVGPGLTMILGYRYNKHGEIYVFVLEGTHYKQVSPKRVSV